MDKPTPGIYRQPALALLSMLERDVLPKGVPDVDFVRAEMLGKLVPGTHASVQAYEYGGWVFVRTIDGCNFAWETTSGAPYPFTEVPDG